MEPPVDGIILEASVLGLAPRHYAVLILELAAPAQTAFAFHASSLSRPETPRHRTFSPVDNYGAVIVDSNPRKTGGNGPQ